MTDLPSDRAAASHTALDRGPSGSAQGSLDRIWSRIRRPMDTPAAIEALVGIPSRAARQLVSATVAGSDTASTLLDAMPRLIRNLSISTVAVPERTVGEVRGPIMWSETVAARSASAGDTGIFVSATLTRAYDTPENRAVVNALSLIARGGRDVDRLGRTGRDEPELFAIARRNGDLAQRFLDHRSLIGVRRAGVPRRTLAQLRHDARRRGYQPVVALIDLAAEPIGVPTLRIFCDAGATADHDLLVGVIDHLERRGVRLPSFLVAEHALVAGPLRYSRSARPGSTTPAGVSIGPHAFRTPDADQGAGTVITGRGDLVAAVDAAIAGEGL